MELKSFKPVGGRTNFFINKQLYNIIVLKNFFEPKSIAVIGVSRSPKKVGRVVFENLLLAKGIKVFAVNPKGKKILGKKVHKGVLSIKSKIDLAVVCVPSKIVPAVLRECAKKRIKSVIIISAGFSEVGAMELANEIKELASKNSISIIGPNCLGIIVPELKMNASFFKGIPRPGSIAFVSQSGALGVALLDKFVTEGYSLHSFVSVGNMLNVTIADIVEHLSKQDEVRVITVYAEALKKGRKFLRVVKHSKKPVIIIKSGKSASGAKAAQSHVGALASDARIYRGIFEQCSAIETQNLNEMFLLAEMVEKQGIPKGKRVLIVTNAGGPGVLLSDALEQNGLEIIKLEEGMLKKLSGFLPKEWSKNNPIDLVGDADAKRYKKTFKVMESQKKSFDIVACLLTPQAMTQEVPTAKAFVSFLKKTQKMGYAVFMGGGKVRRAIKYLKKNKVPCFEEPEILARVLGKLF